MNSNDIAKIAKVSRSTVSRVINGYTNVPEQTRLKVQQVIDEYGYVPNASARTLAGKSNDIIGLFIGDFNESSSDEQWIGINSPYNTLVLNEVIKSCKKRGYSVLVNTITRQEDCTSMQHFFDNRTIYGGLFIGFPYQLPQLTKVASNLDNNIVLIDQLTIDEAKDTKIINCDNEECGYVATNYLLGLGHSKILYIDGDDRLSSMQRKAGYLKALEKHGLAHHQKIISGFYREDIAYESTKEYLLHDIPDAIFVANDIMAIGAIRAIEEKGLQIPRDISIIGVDDIMPSVWKDFLTTIHFDIDVLAGNAVDALFDPSKEYELCKPTIIEKRSCIKRI